MKQLLTNVLTGYMLLAVLTRLAERAGAITCGCSPECWCQKPGLSPFRFVFPIGHTGGSGCS